MSAEFDQENLISIFIDEASDGMKALTTALNPADGGLSTPQQLQEQFIVAHRIKGAAALYGYDGIACLCERLEALCEKATAIPEDEWPRAVGSMRKTVQGIQTLLQTIGNGGSEDRTMVATCLASLLGLLPDRPTPSVSMPEALAVVPEYVAPTIDAKVLSCFVPEAEEYLSAIEDVISTLRADPANKIFTLLLYRTTQTLKGLADTAGFQVIGDIAQRVVDCMGAVQEQRIPLSGELLDSFVHAVSLVRLLLRRDPTTIGRLQSDVPALISILGWFCDRQVSVESPSAVSEPALSPEDPAAVIAAEPESVPDHPPFMEVDHTGAIGAEAEPPMTSAVEWITEPPAPSPEDLAAVIAAEPESVPNHPPFMEVDHTGAIGAEAEPPMTSAVEWITEPPVLMIPAPATPTVRPEYIAPIIDAEVLSYFVPEAEEYLAAIEGLIPTLRADPTNEDAIHRLFRAAHTLKGSAYTVDFQAIGNIAQPMEDCMIAVRERRIPLSGELLDSLTLAVSVIRLLLQRDATAVEQLQSDVPALIAILGRLCDGQTSLEPSAPTSAPDSCPVDVGDSPMPETGAPTVPAAETLPSQSDDYFLPQLDPEVLSYFVPEAGEYLETLEANFLRLDKDAQNRELIDQLFRTAHTLKGSAYTVGFQAIGDLIHHVEDFMGAVRDSRLSVMPGHTDLILRAVDVVHVLMRRDPSTVDVTRQRFQTALSELKQLEQGHAVDASPTVHITGETIQQPDRPSESEEDQGRAGKQAEGRTGEERDVIRVSYARLEQLMNLVGELVIGRGRLEQRLRTLERLSDQVLAYKARMIDSVQSFAGKHTFTIQSAPAGPDAQPATSRPREFGDFGSLELDKYDDFNILARRIGEVSADISESMSQLSGSIRRAQEDMNTLQQLTRTMRDEIGRARMVPVGTPFTRFRRAIREIARALDKQVSLVTSGEHTEVDTGIVEGLVDPLVHLVRNAVYHGIETPTERVANGKPAAGTIYLHAAHRGNSIVIEVEDDGAGLNLVKIREKAVAVGMARRDQVQAMADSDVLQFIFAAGFSTAEKVGDQAGRGVGLDVVKRAIEGMNGHIEVESQPGIGTKFTLSLPLTLLITTALLVRAGTEQYAIALSNIREVTLATATSLDHTNDRTLLHVDEEVIEVQSLRQILHREPTPVSVAMPIVIVRTTTGLLGLAVDELLGRQEIVIKRLGSLKPLERSCFAGATIDPEGRVILVIDPSRLDTDQSMRSVVHRASSPRISPPSDSVAEPIEDTRAGILLIDDSLSIRKFVGRMLESAGYSVDTAVDGDDGIRKASERAYRLVITDLEMPKFNGYEVVQALRARPQTQQTPIIVMTTRAGDKHRQLALDIGANSYIAKPVDERTLLDEIERWVGRTPAGRK